MAQLDPLLMALIDRNARELVLAVGRKPSFRIGDELRSVSQKTLSEAQIAVLLSELVDDTQAALLGAGQPVKFSYQTGGRSFHCETGEVSGAYCARLRPVPAAAPVSAGIADAAPPPAPVPAPEREAAPAPVPVAAPVAEAPVAPRTVARPPAGDRPEIERLLMKLIEAGASDLHMSADETPMLRKDGEMMRIPGEAPLSGEETMRLLDAITPDKNRAEFAEVHDTDFAHEIPDVSRFRANIFMDRKGVGAVFRTIPTKILTAEQLGLPQAILDLCGLRKGLVLVTGPTGSGKSTTLAAMIDYINRTRGDHIITIEDPIEFVHPNLKCLVNQREISTHTVSFKSALRAALREDPDIVLVGEMRDLETVAIAIETAETGHLVFGTLHTSTACSTVERIIDQFPAGQQAQIRTMLSESLKGVVSQTLLKKSEGGRAAALEILVVTPAIGNLVRESKTFQIPSLMQTGKKLGMRLLNEALFELVKAKTVAPEEAHSKAIDKSGFVGLLNRAGIKMGEVEEPV